MKAFRCAAYYSSGLAFFLVSLVLNALCLLALALPFRHRLRGQLRVAIRVLFRFWLGFMERLGVFRIDFSSLRGGTREGPRVVVMNHPTIMDCVYLLSQMPAATPIYKGAIASNPFYGCIARLADFLPNAVGPDMIRAAVERIERGEDILIFPEGTRSTEMRLERFKGGFALIAQRARAPIELLWLDSPRDFLTREVSVWRLPELPVRIRIRSLGVVRPERDENATSLTKRVAERYRKHLEGAAMAS